jgi:hypothetical protein
VITVFQVWTRDGNSIIVNAIMEGTRSIYRKTVDGSGESLWESKENRCRQTCPAKEPLAFSARRPNRRTRHLDAVSGTTGGFGNPQDPGAGAPPDVLA